MASILNQAEMSGLNGRSLVWRRPWFLRTSRYLFSATPFDCTWLGALSLLLFPVFKVARLPLRIDFFQFFSTYWVGTAVGAIFGAVALAVIGLPLSQTLGPFLGRYRQRKGLIAIPLVLVALTIPLLGVRMGLLITIGALAAGELMARRAPTFERNLVDLLVPALYLFFGLILVFAFNHAIVGIRYGGTYDATLNRWDWTLFHANVSAIGHWSMKYLPHWYITLEEVAYFGLFSRIGGALILTSLLGGRQYGLKYVRALLICYTIGLAIFFAIPAKGPYSVSPLNLEDPMQSPLTTLTVATQHILAQRVRLLWAHNLTSMVSAVNVGDYYSSFPSLHAALPVVMIWFLRPWKGIALCALCIYVLLLLPSLVLLEWHYIVDLLGGITVGLMAVWITERISPRVVIAGPQSPELAEVHG